MTSRLCGGHFRPSGFRQSATWWKESGTSVEGPERFFRICSARRKDGGKKVNVHCEVNVRDLVPALRPPHFPFLVWHRDCAEITFDRLGSSKVPRGGKNAEARSRGLEAFSGFVPPGGTFPEKTLFPFLVTLFFHFWYGMERLCGDHVCTSEFPQSAASTVKVEGRWKVLSLFSSSLRSA
jgi:hypothetical protein